MEWRFWKRRWRRKAERASTARITSQERGVPRLPVSTVREVLGLQQLLGNQAVLRILAANTGGTSANGSER